MKSRWQRIKDLFKSNERLEREMMERVTRSIKKGISEAEKKGMKNPSVVFLNNPSSFAMSNPEAVSNKPEEPKPISFQEAMELVDSVEIDESDLYDSMQEMKTVRELFISSSGDYSSQQMSFGVERIENKITKIKGLINVQNLINPF